MEPTDIAWYWVVLLGGVSKRGSEMDTKSMNLISWTSGRVCLASMNQLHGFGVIITRDEVLPKILNIR